VKLVLAGGGTGGHIYPGLAIAEAFRDDAAFAPLDVLFVGTRDRLEAQIVPKAGVPIAFVHAAPLARKPSFSLARTIVANAAGFVESLAILHRAKPDVLIATGGYVALPVVAALRFVRLLGRTKAKIALLEPNAVAGITNRLLAPLVDEVWYAATPARALGTRERVVGTPVRSSMRRAMDPAAARVALGSVSGERGVTPRSVSERVASVLPRILECYRAAFAGNPGAGSGALHLETDGDGVVTAATAHLPIAPSAARCIERSVIGIQFSGVDTGEASADVSLSFHDE